MSHSYPDYTFYFVLRHSFVFFVIIKSNNMNLEQRTKNLVSIFSYTKPVLIEESGITMRPFSFIQRKGIYDLLQLQNEMSATEFCPVKDSMIEENRSFPYIIFTPKGYKKDSKAILLLHGLNERNWNKYLVWAEELVIRCGKPVILFPIAFHMNRTPQSWASPRWVMPFSSIRKNGKKEITNITAFNYILSSRLSISPLRFYISGRQSIYNLWQLFSEIRNGDHELFNKKTDIDIFAYSIGSFLAQIALIANPDNLLEETKLFSFCGGSIFDKMNGSAKDILDEEANLIIHQYYLEKPISIMCDKIEKGFNEMVTYNRLRGEREDFFMKTCSRMKFLTLKKDTVMPTEGVREAIGKETFIKIGEEIDFPFQYSHQIPFHIDKGYNDKILNSALESMLERAQVVLA